MRLFIAIAIPPAVQDQVSLLYQGLPGVRWTPKEKLHLTLKFLGETDAENANLLEIVFSPMQPKKFALQLSGVGCFTDRHFVRTIWAGFNHSQPLFDLQREIETILETQCSIAREARHFTPHLTLARPKNLTKLKIQPWLEKYANFSSEPFAVGEFYLIQSHTRSSGAEYKTLKKFNLQ